jgi:glycosyltransferase involved in cell wall biosynthesis
MAKTTSLENHSGSVQGKLRRPGTLLAINLPSPPGKIALIGSYLPRKCGIATFTSDLYQALCSQYPDTACLVIAINDIETGYAYAEEVRFEVYRPDLAAYQRAADFLNIEAVDLVCLQHEFGVFGGPAGRNILALLREVRAPIVTTLHTVLRDPDRQQEQVMLELCRLSTRLVVMTRFTRQLLIERYSVPANRIDLIAHGIPDTTFIDPDQCKEPFGVSGKTVVLTFGLLSPGKGIEYFLAALPAIVERFSELVYIVLGATHPHLLRENGEAYRLSLELLAKELGIERHVIFYNRFVELSELKEFIGAADLYVTPYLNEAQAVSGTLAYAFGCGKPVISTPYWHAKELLQNGLGRLVPFADSSALAEATIELLQDSEERQTMSVRAYELGRDSVWSRSSQAYMASFEQARRERSHSLRVAFATRTLDQQPGALPHLKLDHLSRLTDSTGIFQHAKYAVPNFEHGYCTDDNARALILTVLLEELGGDSSHLSHLRSAYLAFLHSAFDPEGGSFRNFLSFDRRWLETIGSEDSQARAIWALGVAVKGARLAPDIALAGHLFSRALPRVLEFRAPRAMAFSLLGIQAYLTRFAGDRQVAQVEESLSEQLYRLFERVATRDWMWCENYLAYDNPRLPQALLAGCRQDWTEMGIRALAWLMEIQTKNSRHLRPIGCNHLYRRGEARPFFDQQPVEVWATISACLQAYRVTGDVIWHEQARKSFDWFLGRNDLGLPIYDHTTGGCRDGLHSDRVNENQGAESTLSFLLSLAEMSLSRNLLSTLAAPSAPR